MFTFLYKMDIRPRLEHCVQSWSLYLAKDTDKLENYNDMLQNMVEYHFQWGS